MDPFFVGTTLTVIGEILIGLAVLNVHKHVIHEHRIDEYVLKAMRNERTTAMFGIVLIIIGYVIKLYAEGYISAIG